MSTNETLRERIIKILRDSSEPLTADNIITLLGLADIKSRDVYEHLKHIAKSVRAKGHEVLVMIPPSCRTCGFTFTNLDKPKKPSKCPKCKSERIAPPAFKIVSRDQV
ncbi:MAG: transcriptional regulator [Candidatus Nezhaarchaeota archaeon]|nr:transcriptional regulator [Candidatus Nezhaarchaeota archaeon]